MIIITCIIIYLLGAVANFLLLRKIFMTVDGNWEGPTKQLSYVYSLGSWISFFALILAWFIHKLNND